MFITPVSGALNVYNAKSLPDKRCVKKYGKLDNSVDSVSFSGGLKTNPEVLKNQFRIFLTQDIWAKNLAVKMPESDLEKEVLLEVLNHRKALDRFARISNEKAKLLFDIGIYNSLVEKCPNHPDLKELAREINKRGNITSVLGTMDKNIEAEAKKHKASLDYFRNIEKISDEYLESRVIKVNALEKFWQQIKKNNINAEHKYSTQDLIDIVSGKVELPKETKAAEKTGLVSKYFSKKQLISSAKAGYEKFLRENVNVYMGPNQGIIALKGKKLVYNINEESIKKYPGVEKQIQKAFHEVQQKFLKKTDVLGDTDIYAVGEIWAEMNKGIIEMQNKVKEIHTLNEQLINSSDKAKCLEAIEIAKNELNAIKKDWIEALKYGNNYERLNRARIEANGNIEAYDFLVGANKEILRYKELEEICDKNGGKLPDEIWAEILA